MTRLDLRPYCLPLARPWRAASHVVRERRGWLVVASVDAINGYGDCAPLPEAGTETSDTAGDRLESWRRLAVRTDAEALLGELRRDWPTDTPSADCAVETALLDLIARQRSVSLYRLLGGPECLAPEVAVNAALGRLDDSTEERATRAASAGFRVIKLKLGLRPAMEEIEQVRDLAARLGPDIRLRLDANRAWDGKTAETVIAGLAGLPIDSIEEPLHTARSSLLRRLQRNTSIDLALDESLAGFGRTVAPGRIPVRRLVLKPGVIGGLRPTLELARRARAHRRAVVLTSLVDSAAGLWATAQLAAATGIGLAHGLDTGAWLAEDLGPPPIPVEGRIRLPALAGSGFATFRDCPSG